MVVGGLYLKSKNMILDDSNQDPMALDSLYLDLKT